MTETLTYQTINTQSGNTLKFRIDEINEMKDYFISEIYERGTMSN